MSQLASFYGTLLSIQVTVFGIITAAVLVFLQIAYAGSHRHSLRLLRDRYLVGYFIFSTTALLVTALGTLLLSLGSHDYIPFWNLGVQSIFRKAWAPAALLFSTGLSVALFGFVVQRNLKYLHPRRALLSATEQINAEDIRLFLGREYGIDPPTLDNTLADIPDSLLAEILPFLQGGAPEPSEAEKKQLREELETKKKAYEVNSKRLAELKKRAASAEDPLDFISAVMFTAIKSSDFPTMLAAQESLRQLSISLLTSTKPSAKDEWDPYKEVSESWTEHVLRLVALALEVAEKEGVGSASLTILRITQDLSGQLLEGRHVAALLKLMAFWKGVADRAIGGNKSIFMWVVKSYESLGSVALKHNVEEPCDQTFRDLGWIGERLLDKKGLETKPIMYDSEYSTEYDELMNVLLTFGSTYSSEFPSSYPLIYFDALVVVFNKLVKVRINHRDVVDLKNDLFSSISKLSVFAEAAIRVANSRGAALAVMRLKQCYDRLVENDLLDSAGDVADVLIHTACLAAASEDKVKPVEFMHEGIVEYIIKLLASSPLKEEIQAAVRESLIKSHGLEHERVWRFITKLGKAMMTNFGLMFDWTTGLIYPEDDPRRFNH